MLKHWVPVTHICLTGHHWSKWWLGTKQVWIGADLSVETAEANFSKIRLQNNSFISTKCIWKWQLQNVNFVQIPMCQRSNLFRPYHLILLPAEALFICSRYQALFTHGDWILVIAHNICAVPMKLFLAWSLLQPIWWCSQNSLPLED